MNLKKWLCCGHVIAHDNTRAPDRAKNIVGLHGVPDQHPDHRGGGATLTVSLTVKRQFFNDSPNFPLKKFQATIFSTPPLLWKATL